MPVADKLIQVAETYGFDGWFINQETEGAEERTLTRDDAVKMQEFIKYFKKQAPEMRLVYYDSMTSEGKMDWQNALTDKNTMFMTDEEGNAVADEMFLNFWWTEDELADKDLLKASGEKAEELGISPYDLYAGVDVQAEGYLTPVAATNGSPLKFNKVENMQEVLDRFMKSALPKRTSGSLPRRT